MTTPVYALDHVERVYRSGSGEVRAVDGVTLDINAGEFVAIEGPSGSGKSTMLQLLGALDRPSAGNLTFEGDNLGTLSEAARTRLRRNAIGFVFQSFNLIPTLTAAENVEAAMAPIRGGAAGRRERVESALAQVGLTNRKNHQPSQLSGGEQQRVAIARALANSPRVILADEPTGNLDSKTSGEVMDILARLSADQGVTLILVTHADDVARRAGRRIAMRDGQLVDNTGFEPAI
ncbi:MAG: putative transport system ATP-binding protein [Acidimicrobiaceae bacterium]|jgi:putative ABC transport system ATP-binding protein|nr:putative transport system ATP-binding protein [Acidimicrobiaceae bacterium]